jgi:hypothetical protein
MKIEDEQLAERLLRFREMTRSIGFENLYYPSKERDLEKFASKNELCKINYDKKQ